ncbi:MAG: hypothetical protein KGJ62_04820 [Armatimonadetes bacterium]|nr:hypothetical protein [Armatimonadota bacterium]MDE2205383.1 hypothetical protein [Armatimonadota bacterium]
MSPPVLGADDNVYRSPEDPAAAIIGEARALMTQGASLALQRLSEVFYLDVSSDAVIDNVLAMMRTAMAFSGEQASEELSLFERLQAERGNAESYFRIGARFQELGNPRVALPFLIRARDLAAPHTTEFQIALGTTLARAHMQSGAYQAAVLEYHKVSELLSGLPGWLMLELAECYALLRQCDDAERVLEAAPREALSDAADYEQALEETADLIARVREFTTVADPGIREWHYAQTRGAVMSVSPTDVGFNGRYPAIRLEVASVALLCAGLCKWLSLLDLRPKCVSWLGPAAEPLALHIAALLSNGPTSTAPWSPGSNIDGDAPGLLVLAHSWDVQYLASELDLQELATARSGMLLFCLQTGSTEPQPVTPDISGMLAESAELPWETPGTTAAQTAADWAAALAEQAPDTGATEALATELEQAYEGFTDLLLNHRDGTLPRRILPGHSPLNAPNN